MLFLFFLLQEAHRHLAARRRMLEHQVSHLVASAVRMEAAEEDDGYEEICFGPSTVKEENNHYLTPISIGANSK